MIQEGWAPSAYLERMDNSGKLSSASQRNGSSSTTPSSIDSMLSSNKLSGINNLNPRETQDTNNFGASELEKITNDIVSALR